MLGVKYSMILVLKFLIILSLKLCFPSEVPVDNGACMKGLVPWLTWDPAIHILLASLRHIFRSFSTFFASLGFWLMFFPCPAALNGLGEAVVWSCLVCAFLGILAWGMVAAIFAPGSIAKACSVGTWARASSGLPFLQVWTHLCMEVEIPGGLAIFHGWRHQVHRIRRLASSPSVGPCGVFIVAGRRRIPTASKPQACAMPQGGGLPEPLRFIFANEYPLAKGVCH